MSLGKKIVIAAMILIAVVAAVIIGVENKNTYDINEKLAQAAGYYGMMDYDKTIATYNEILAKDKTCAEAYVGLASAYSAKGNETKAFEILEQGVEATRNDKRIADKIAEMSDDIILMSEATDVTTEFVTEAPIETTVETVTTVPVTEVTTVPETVTTEETTEATTEMTTETTTEATTTTPETTTVTTPKTTIVTTAKPTITVPNFIGVHKDEAAKIAKNKNIKLVFEYENNDTYPNGVIYYQSSREGTLVAPSTTVYAYVCKNNTEYVTEETKTLRNLTSALKKWADSSKVSSVAIDEKNNAVTIYAASTKRFVLDENVVSAIRKCSGATLRIVASDFTMSINTASVSDTTTLDLSADYSGNQSRASFTIADGADECDIRVVLTNCEINSNDYEDMKLYLNNKKPSAVDLSIDEEPVILVSKSGTYTIK